MRISDWSSDVCSSDLLHAQVLVEIVCGGQIDQGKSAKRHLVGGIHIAAAGVLVLGAEIQGLDAVFHAQVIDLSYTPAQLRALARLRIVIPGLQDVGAGAQSRIPPTLTARTVCARPCRGAAIARGTRGTAS